MKVFRNLAAFQTWARAKKKLGLVPTMGALHEGHLSLVRRCRRESEACAVSIFVNPTQFGPKEDFNRYPRNLRRDLALLRPLKVEAVLAPPPAAMYPPGWSTMVRLKGPLVRTLEGRSRPGHFDGVATVVAKLFALATPRWAYFGQKDYQQLLVVRRMALDLGLGVKVVGCPVVREKDGLALSSRNAYLSKAERAVAPRLVEALRLVRRHLAVNSASEARRAGLAYLKKAKAFKIDYFEIRDAASLTVPVPGKPRRALAAVGLGNVRLIDNIHV